MDGLLWYLVIGGLFYFMMRHGCGAHLVHGHGGHGGHGGHRRDDGHGTQEAKSTDPVCGMAVADDTGYSEMYQGVRYRFCSRKCLDQFDAEPGKYAGAPAHRAGGGT